MSKNYYCLVSGLKDITIEDTKLPFSSSEFMEELAETLLPKDYDYFCNFKLRIDNENILNLLTNSGKEFKNGGIFSKEELLEEIKEPENLYEFQKNFIEEFTESSQSPYALWEDRLAELYYQYLEDSGNQFLSDWYQFNFNIKNCLTALNCREFNYNPAEYVLGNTELSRKMIHSTARDLGIAQEFTWIEDILTIRDSGSLVEQERKIDILKWEYLDNKTFFEYFSIEKVLSFYFKLEIIERWSNLSQEEGYKSLEKMKLKLENSFQFSKEFTI